MPGGSATSRKWIAGALHGGRAAAFLTIAVGLNGALAALLPRDQSIYVYLLAVIVVSALSNVLIGTLTAIAGVLVYGWMTSPGHLPSAPVIATFIMASLVTMATRAAIQVKRPSIPLPAEPPLLPPMERPAAVEYVLDDERANQLNRELAGVREELAKEARLRAAAANAARQRETDLENQIEALRERAADQGNRSVAARRELDALTKQLSDAEARATALQQGLDVAQKKADQEHARADREAKMREQLEIAGHESLQKAAGELSAKHDAAMLEAKQRLEVAARKLEIVQKELREERARAERETSLRAQNENAGTGKLQNTIADLSQKLETMSADAQKRAEAATAKTNALQRELDRTLASLADEHARADREAKLRAQLEVAARTTLHRTADVAAGRQREAEEARQTAVAAQEKVTILEREAEHLRAKLDELSSRHNERAQELESSSQRTAALLAEIEALRSAAERQRSEAETTFQQYASAAEQERASFHAELEAARHAADHERLRADLEATSRGKLAEELAALRQEMDSLRSAVTAERQRVADLQTDRDQAAAAIAAKEALEAELNAARTKLDELQSAVTAERQRVAGLQTDREQMSAAIAAKEAIEAELNAANAKLHELQTAKNELDVARTVIENERKRAAQFQTERDRMATEFDSKLQSIINGISTDHENAIGDLLLEKSTARAEIRQLTKKLQEAQQSLEEERQRNAGGKAALEKLDAEWGEKLQKIVAHLTEDHESDVGEALLAKEAARAEVRNLSAKVTLLQQRMEEEREKFRQAADRWQQERASLLSRRGAYPPTIEQPIPAQAEPVKAATVLVVHSDAGVRAATMHSLQQAGYTVVAAADGLEGLRAATQQRPDVVLTEAVMPKMNARELVQLLKSRRETADVKIILISAGGPVERGTDFRADDVIANPGDANALRTVLANVLSRRSVPS